MKAGDKITCPHCQQETFVKEKAVLDGWTVKEKILICPMCNFKLADAKEETPEQQIEKKNASIAALASFLGDVKLERPILDISEDIKRFCKDCKHFIEHPFHTRCGFWDKEINPMDDCEKFERKAKKTEPDRNLDK